MPVAEYCSPIWRQNRITIERTLERTLHYATRSALGAPSRTDVVNYKSFSERLIELHMLTFGARRIIASIIFLIRIIREQLDSEILNVLNGFRHTPTYSSQSPNIFVFDRRSVVSKSPIHIAMMNINMNKDVFDFHNDSIDVIRNKMKAHLHSQRPE